MRKAIIVKTAVATGLGKSLDETWNGLLAGKSAIKTIQHFNTDRIDFHKASCIDGLHNNKNENPIVTLVKDIARQIGPLPENTYIIWTGIKGNVPFIESGQKLDGPYLPVHYRKLVAELLGIKNSGVEVNAACASSTVGLAVAAQKISSGEYSNILVIAADIVSRFVHMGFSALKALTAKECRPFDQNRDGLFLGDGAVAIHLTNDHTADQKGYDKLAKISGWGIANDANHITGPARDGCGLILSIEAALKQAGINANQIQAFCAHGTGTVFNDGMELTAIESLFGDRRFPVFSVKGAIGHTLGAAGGIETAISIKALQDNQIPQTAGLLEPEERASGRVFSEPMDFEGDNILTTNSGFGGVNAALILEKMES
jgi:3-oxoacyl-(acyl-carrier-protein) synthase